MREMREIKSLVDGIDGWLSDTEGELLYELARNCTGRGVIVEIGSWKGKSTVWLGKGVRAGGAGKIFAVDPHLGFVEADDQIGKGSTFEEFQQNIRHAGIADLITPIVKTSEEAARDFNLPVELIFIDGLHEYEFARQDFELWFPKVIDGGIMAFHDTNGRSGSTRVVDEMVYRSNHFKEVRFADSITAARKVTSNTIFDKARNRSILMTKNVALPSFGLQGRLSFVPRPIRNAAKKCVKVIEKTAFGSKSNW